MSNTAAKKNTQIPWQATNSTDAVQNEMRRGEGKLKHYDEMILVVIAVILVITS